MSQNVNIATTKDDSSTLYSNQYKEHYHSTHGALQESEYVFIEKGLNYFKKNKLVIFEMGFGTGLNAYLTFLRSNCVVEYDCIETEKLDFSIVEALNYPSLLEQDKTIFLSLHQAKWDKDVVVNKDFVLHKYYQDIQLFEFKKEYDLIYFDAFSPRIQPDLWSEETLLKCYDALSNQGLLVTYCAKSEVRRTLQKIGFRVEKCPGPPGKREMLRAFK